MEHILSAWAWFKAHFGELAALWVGIIGAAEIAVKWTDSQKDDEVLGKIRAAGVKVISWLTKFGLEAEKAPKVK